MKREITVDEAGLHVELDKRYAEDLVNRMRLEEAKAVRTPGSKGTEKKDKGKPLSQREHRE